MGTLLAYALIDDTKSRRKLWWSEPKQHDLQIVRFCAGQIILVLLEPKLGIAAQLCWISKMAVEICILAGGLSRRMGRDKARLRLGSKTLLGWISAAARKSGAPVRIIRRDIVLRCGPLSGIYTALKSTQMQAVLFLACDMPFVSLEMIESLLEEARANDEAIIVWSNAGAGFPLITPGSALGIVAGQMERGEFSLRNLATALKARRIRVPRSMTWQLVNVNTPADLERARVRVRQRKWRPKKRVR